jgi:hypothetical protein
MANRRTPETPSRARSAPRTEPTDSPSRVRARRAAGAAVTAEARREMIAENAYLRAERRGFAPGHEVADWLAAEQEVDALLKSRHGGAAQ